jgi:hypothetical protein
VWVDLDHIDTTNSSYEQYEIAFSNFRDDTTRRHRRKEEKNKVGKEEEDEEEVEEEEIGKESNVVNKNENQNQKDNEDEDESGNEPAVVAETERVAEEAEKAEKDEVGLYKLNPDYP